MIEAWTERSRLIPAIVFAASVVALAGALIGQFVFALEPCSLCLYQRVPYVVAALLAGAALLVPGGGLQRTAVALCAVAFSGGAALAFFHVGVEAHWWTSGIPGCGADAVAGALSDTMTIADLQARLAGPPPTPCDQVRFRFLGLSLAGYNVIISLVLAGLAGLGVRVPLRRPATA